MGFSYNKRKNMVELAACRECTASPNALQPTSAGNNDPGNREGDSGWPGMMTIKVHELDGTHDHLLPMAGDAWQLLEIKCHSRLAAKRFQKPKKGSKPDGSDDNGDAVTAVDIRSGYCNLAFVLISEVITYPSKKVKLIISFSECQSVLLAVRNPLCCGSELTQRWSILLKFTLTSLCRCG